MLNTSV